MDATLPVPRRTSVLSEADHKKMLRLLDSSLAIFDRTPDLTPDDMRIRRMLASLRNDFTKAAALAQQQG